MKKTREKGKSRNLSPRGKIRGVNIILVIIISSLIAVILLLPKAGETEELRTSSTSNREEDFDDPAVPLNEDPGNGQEDYQQPLHTEPENSDRISSLPGTETARPQIEQDYWVSIVLDDAGYNMYQLTPFLALDIPLTISVLPGLPYTKEAAAAVIESGKEVMLHFPMEAEKGNDPGPGSLNTAMTREQIRKTVRLHLTEIPGIIGINNHMGSAATADRKTMDLFFEALTGTDIFFLDSRTTPETVAAEFAGIYDIPYIERSVFIDNNKDASAMEKAVREGLELAEREGSAVFIGHVWSSDLPGILEKVFSEKKYRNKLIPISQMLTVKE
jgi:hypothetical protein